MKKCLLLALSFLLVWNFSFVSHSQAAKKKPEIKADKQYYDSSSGLHHLKGNVYVAMANYIVTADEATVDLSRLHVWAKGNVVLKQDSIVFSGNSVYVIVKENKAQITDNLCFKRDNLSITADYAEYNWSTKIATISGNVIVAKEDAGQESYQMLKYNVVDNEFIESTK